MVRGNLRVEDAKQVEKDHKQQRCPEHGSHGADNGKHDGAQGTEVPGPLLNDTRCASAASTTVRSDVPTLRQQTTLCSTLSNTVQRMLTWLPDLATACTLLKDMLRNGPTSSPSSGASASQQGAPAIKTNTLQRRICTGRESKALQQAQHAHSAQCACHSKETSLLCSGGDAPWFAAKNTRSKCSWQRQWLIVVLVLCAAH